MKNFKALGLCILFGLWCSLTDAQEQGQEVSEFERRSFEESGINVEELHAFALEGDADAQYQLGQLHLVGLGVKEDYEKARHWLSLSAESGYAPGMSSFGQLFLTGRGVSRDLDQARAWVTRASEKGHEPSKKLLRIIDRIESADCRPSDDQDLFASNEQVGNSGTGKVETKHCPEAGSDGAR